MKSSDSTMEPGDIHQGIITSMTIKRGTGRTPRFKGCSKKRNTYIKMVCTDWLRLTGARVRDKALFEEECYLIHARLETVYEQWERAIAIWHPICSDWNIVNLFIFNGMKSLSRKFEFVPTPLHFGRINKEPGTLPVGALIPSSMLTRERVLKLLFPFEEHEAEAIKLLIPNTPGIITQDALDPFIIVKE